MCKKLLTLAIIVATCFASQAQELDSKKDFNRFTVDLSGGLLTSPSSDNGGIYDLGVRYSLTQAVSLGLTAKTSEFNDENLTLGDFNVYFNLMQICKMHKAIPNWSWLMYGAVGYYDNESNDGTALSAGTMLQYAVTNRIAVLGKVETTGLSADKALTGFDNNFTQLALGLSIRIGNKNKKHIDHRAIDAAPSIDYADLDSRYMKTPSDELAELKKQIDYLETELDDIKSNCCNEAPAAVKCDESYKDQVIYFDMNKTNLDNSGVTACNNIKQYLANNPNETLVIIGSASPEGTDSINDPLASKRAQAVYNKLIEMGVDESRIYTFSAGSRYPIARKGLKTTRCVIFDRAK